MLPRSGQLKYQAKATMGQGMSLWIKATLLVVVLQVISQLFLRNWGAVQGWGIYLAELQSLPDAITSFTAIQGGFELYVRMDQLGVVGVVSMTLDRALFYLLGALVVLVLLAPLKIGTLEQYWKVFYGEKPEMKLLARWYAKPKLLLKAVLAELIVGLGCRVFAIAAMVPSAALYMLVYMNDYAGATGMESMFYAFITILAFFLMLGGAAAAFCLYTVMVPIRFCLAAKPDYSVKMMLRRGLDSMKGYRKQFCLFRFGFLPWYLVSNFTMGAMDLYLLPYLSFSTMHFMQEAARDRENRATAAPVSQQ